MEDCRFAPSSDPACVAAAVADIDAARAEEGLAPITLPDDFEQLTVTQQLLVVTDLERVDRGLEPFEGLSPRLDAYAQQGAEAGTDPPWPEPLEGFVGGGNWIGGTRSALLADYLWMYDDGAGFNLDCNVEGEPGCWGHRKNILGEYGTELAMGAAADGGSLTELFIGYDAQASAGGIDAPTQPLWPSFTAQLPVGIPSSVWIPDVQSSVEVPVWASGENMSITATVTTNSAEWSVKPGSCALAAGSQCDLTVADHGLAGQSGTLTIVGPNGPQSVSLAKVGPPTVKISTPEEGAIYPRYGAVIASYSCEEASGGPRLSSCDGSTPDGNVIETSTTGPHTFQATAQSSDGQSATQTVNYLVAGPPSVTIEAPVEGAVYTQDEVIHANYVCVEGSFGPGLASCTGTVSRGAAINTSQPGTHTLEVVAKSKDGQSTTRIVTYMVTPALPVAGKGAEGVGDADGTNNTGGDEPTHAVAMAAIGRAVASLLTTHGASTLARRMLEDGAISQRVNLPAAGTLTLKWWRTSSATRRLLIATGNARRRTAGAVTITLRLTAAGRRLLRKSPRVTLVAEASFTADDGLAVSERKRLILRR